MDKSITRSLLSVSEHEPIILEGTWKRASVLALFLPDNDGEKILFTRRTEHVVDHKGQVSFPGGAVEPEDASMEDAALREAREEIGLDPSLVDVLGRSRDLFTPSGWWITPVVGWYQHKNGFIRNPVEVSRIFTIPVNWLADPSNWEIRSYSHNGVLRNNVIFYKTFDDEMLWGITAHLVQDLLRKLKMMK